MQNDQSYEQVYGESSKQEEEDAYQTQLMLDENDQIELLADSQEQSPLQDHNTNIQSKLQAIQRFQKTKVQCDHQEMPSYLHDVEDNSSKDQKNSRQATYAPNQAYKEVKQTETNLDYDTEKVLNVLTSKYGHFNQQILIKMLYDRCFPHPQKTQQSLKTQPTRYQLKRQTKTQGINEHTDFENIKKLNRTVKVFVQHGYGINIARKFAAKGETIQPNPYNNLIGKIIKQTWKAIEVEISKIRKSMKPLNTERFNQIKTPLVNSRTWMKKQYLDIFNKIIEYIHGLRNQKPSVKEYQMLYDLLVSKAKGKRDSREKGFYKKKKLKHKWNDNTSSDDQSEPRRKKSRSKRI